MKEPKKMKKRAIGGGGTDVTNVTHLGTSLGCCCPPLLCWCTAVLYRHVCFLLGMSELETLFFFYVQNAPPTVCSRSRSRSHSTAAVVLPLPTKQVRSAFVAFQGGVSLESSASLAPTAAGRRWWKSRCNRSAREGCFRRRPLWTRFCVSLPSALRT